MESIRFKTGDFIDFWRYRDKHGINFVFYTSTLMKSDELKDEAKLCLDKYENKSFIHYSEK